MTVNVRLSNADNYAIAVFPKSAGRYTIVVGNIREGEVPAANELLLNEATAFFGHVEEAGSAKGSVPGRWDAFVVVGASQKRVMAFVHEKLGGGLNQQPIDGGRA